MPTNRDFYLNMAQQGLRMPIGTDLVLAEKPGHKAIKNDGRRLGEVVAESARRWQTPLAMPLMDLMIEKDWLVGALGVPHEEIATYHFLGHVPEKMPEAPATVRARATSDAIQYIAQNSDLLPCGMSIGPFSLMTKLIADPITPVFMAGLGEDDREVQAVQAALNLGMQVIVRNVSAQIAAGAKAIVVCEPAANTTYFSPNQFAQDGAVFERFVMNPNRQLKALLDQHGVDLIWHDCGELADDMVRQFATLNPVMMSFGSSRLLWEDAQLVPKDIVLFGNLPTKKFYSDDVMPLGQVQAKAQELLKRMKATGHPFILGSECDVLSVPGSEQRIKQKVAAFLNA